MKIILYDNTVSIRPIVLESWRF